MDLETIKKSNDSWWLSYLDKNTVSDADKIKSEKDWLIKALEVHREAIYLALVTLENNNMMGEEYHKIHSMLDTLDEI